MDSLDLTKPDTALAPLIPKDVLCAIRFAQNRKDNFERVLKLCGSADVFIPQEIGTRGRKEYLAIFGRHAKGFDAAYKVLEELRVASWKYTLIANNRIQRNKFAMINFLDCYMQAKRCKNHEAHCHEVVDFEFSEDEDDFLSPDIKEQWLIPCSHIEGFISYSPHKGPMLEAFEAAALERNTNLCIYMHAGKLRKIEKLKKAKKKYW